MFRAASRSIVTLPCSWLSALVQLLVRNIHLYLRLQQSQIRIRYRIHVFSNSSRCSPELSLSVVFPSFTRLLPAAEPVPPFPKCFPISLTVISKNPDKHDTILPPSESVFQLPSNQPTIPRSLLLSIQRTFYFFFLFCEEEKETLLTRNAIAASLANVE